MGSIMTVLGPIDPAQLGVTTMHEHILMKGGIFRELFLAENPGITEPVPGDAKICLENAGLLRRNNMLVWEAQNLDDEEAMCGEVQDYRESGGNSILELSVPGIRGDVEGIRRIAEKTGVNVIVATGLYMQYSWPDKFLDMDISGLMAYMQYEIAHGVDGTGIRPGVLKIGMSRLTRLEEAALRAAVRVSKDTGISLTVHPSTGIGGDGRAVVKILKQEGMDLSRVVIAHVGGQLFPSDMKYNVLHPGEWKLRLDYAKALLDSGVNISIEFLNQSDRELEADVNPTDWIKMAGLVELIKQDYTEQIVLGTDLCAKPMARRFGGEGYCRLTRFALPMLTDKMGVSPYAVRQIMEENPKRLLAY